MLNVVQHYQLDMQILYELIMLHATMLMMQGWVHKVVQSAPCHITVVVTNKHIPKGITVVLFLEGTILRLKSCLKLSASCGQSSLSGQI